MRTRIACDVCGGRAFERPTARDAFPMPCRICGGRGAVSLWFVARETKLDRSQLVRVLRGEAKARASAVVLEALVSWLEPKTTTLRTKRKKNDGGEHPRKAPAVG